MKTFYVFLFVALIFNASIGMDVRRRRQTEDNEDDLEDRYGWFRPAWIPTRRPPQWQRPTMSTTIVSTTNADNNAVVQECIRNCPVTSEYNPVCGTNNVTYSNPGRLTCAQACGVPVNLFRSAPCPTAAAS